jgi:transcriptional repressor NF-X1
VQAAIGESGLHECDLVCGKVLSCGNHRMNETIEGSARLVSGVVLKRYGNHIFSSALIIFFSQMTCYCGKTVLEQPILVALKLNAPIFALDPLLVAIL